MAQQANWRFCQGCHAMFFAGYQGGRCATGGPHVAQGVNFVLPYDVPSGPTAQQGWRFCVRCNTMFYERGGGGGCPAGGSHSGQGIDSFALPYNVSGGPGAQGDWHRCTNCNAMFFGGFGGGRCPAGDKHAADANNFVLPYNMDGYLVWQSETISDPSKYFVSKSDPASAAGRGAKIANGRVWRQELALGGRADIGIAGVISWKNVSLVLSNGTIASAMTYAALGEYSAGPDGVRLAFQVVGIAGGSAMLVAYDSGHPFASMQIFVTGAVAAEAGYVDDFQDFAYDPSYNAENGNRSTTIAVRYYDDVVVPIDYRDISDGRLVPDMQVKRIGRGGRLYPLVLNAATTPKLHAAKRQVQEILEAMLYEDVKRELLRATMEIAFYVSLYEMGGLAGGVFRIVGRGGVRALMREVVALPEALRAFFRRGSAAGANEAMFTGAGRFNGLISRGAKPPGMPEAIDPFTGEAMGVSARAGTKASMRTAIDASGAEFESFKKAVFERGEIGIQSPGGANAPGVDFVTAQRRADGTMEVLLNDATINGRKIPKTTPPSKWVDEARDAVAPGRLDLGNAALEQEIQQAMASGRYRIRTLQVQITPEGVVNVAGW